MEGAHTLHVSVKSTDFQKGRTINSNSEGGSWSYCEVFPLFCRLEQIALEGKAGFLSIWVDTDSFPEGLPTIQLECFCLFMFV